MSDHTHDYSSDAGVYLKTLIGLFILTGITVGAAFINFGSSTVNVIIALSIATVKATLVALIFMHLRHDRPVNAIIFTSSLFFLGVFIGFCLIDQESRPYVVPSNLREPVAAVAPAAPGGEPAAPAPAEHGAPAPVHH